MLTLATLSVHNFVNSVGAWVGFGSIVAVAILILLYFAHARETATLRDRLDEAQARIGGLETRVAQLISAQAAAQTAAQRGRVPAPVVPAPALRPPGVNPAAGAVGAHAAGLAAGAGVGSVRRVPVTDAATQVGVPAGLAGAGDGSALLPAAPAGTGAPALASATRLIPDPPELSKAVRTVPAKTDGAPDDTLFVPGSAVAAVTAAAAASAAAATIKPQAAPAPVASGAAPGSASEPAAEAPAPTVAASQAGPAVAAVSARAPSASPRGVAAAPSPEGAAAAGAAAARTGASPPPRVQIGADADSPNGGPRRANPRARPAEPLLPPMDAEGGHRRRSGRVLPLLISGIAVAVIVVGLIVITNNGGSSPAAASSSSNPTGESISNKHNKPVPFKPSKYTVAVLNGTAVAGLAGDVSTKLGGQGFHRGNATNADSQTHGATVVYYMPGAHAAQNKIAATHVAKSLVRAGSAPPVRPATQPAIKSCSINAAGASLGSCSADVIVLVGSDRADLASSGSGG